MSTFDIALESRRAVHEADLERQRAARMHESDLAISEYEMRSHGIGRGASPLTQEEYNAADRRRHAVEFRSYLETGVAGDFLNALARGDPLAGAEARDMGVGVGSSGGFLAAPAFADALHASLRYRSAMVDNALILNTNTGRPLGVPVVDDTATFGTGHLAENTTIGSSVDITLGLITLNAFMYSSKPLRYSWQLWVDAQPSRVTDFGTGTANDPSLGGFDVEAALGTLVGERLGRQLNLELTTGTGGGVMPQGVFAAGAVTTAVTLSAGNTLSVTFQGLMDLLAACDVAYRNDPSFAFMMHPLTAGLVRDLKDSQGLPIFDPTKALTIAGKPVIENPDAPQVGVSHVPVIAGAWGKGYAVRMDGPASVHVLVERYADTLERAVFATQRADGQVIDSRALRGLANSAT